MAKKGKQSDKASLAQDKDLKQSWLACLQASLALIEEGLAGRHLPVTSREKWHREEEGRIAFELVRQPDVLFLMAFFHPLSALKEFENLHSAVVKSEHAGSILADLSGNPITDVRDQRYWLMNSLVIPLLTEYIDSEPFLQFERERAESVYASLVLFLEANAVEYSLFAPLHNFSGPDSDIEFGDTTKIRRLSNDELGYLLGSDAFGGALDRESILFCTHCVSRVQAVPKGPRPFLGICLSEAEEALRNVATALRLSKPGQVGTGALVYQPVEPVFGSKRGGALPSLALLPPGPRYFLTLEEANTVVSIYERLKSLTPTGAQQVALSRFNLAHERTWLADRLIDYWIALEALFLAEGERGELSYRASMRIAYLLGKNPAGRERLFRDARESYNARSKIVHGEIYRFLPRVLGATEDILRRALREAIDNPSILRAARLDSRISRGS